MELYIALLMLPLACANPFVAFHANYVQRVVPAHSVAAAQATASCPAFKCARGRWPEGECLNYYHSRNEYLLKPCPEDQFCPWAWFSSDATTNCLPLTPSLCVGLPGDPCGDDDDSQCQGNSTCQGKSTCQGEICVGLSSGEPCDDQPDCDVGLVCHNEVPDAKCIAQGSLGEVCGEYITNNLCKNNLICSHNKCAEVFTKGPGDQVDATAAEFLCNTGFYQYFDDELDDAVCMPAPRSPRYPIAPECSAGSFCLSDDGLWAIECECGFNEAGRGFCPLFPGDALYQEFLSQMMSYMKDPVLNKCHYLDIGQEECPHNEKAVLDKIYSAKLAVDYYAKRLQNEQCVKEMITYPYWGLNY